jgi:hypothetical protein
VTWVVVVAVVALSLVALTVALLRAWRAGKGLAREVARASESMAPLSELEVGAPAAPAPPLSESELRAREAALLVREAELERRLRRAPS